jgi:hypothetical protein
MKSQLKLLPCFLLVCVCVNAQKLPSNACSNSPLLAALSKGSDAYLLKAYGYDLREPWACTKLESSWTAGATILRFRRITAQTDDQTAFAIVKAPDLEYIWVIPTAIGMLEVAHAESDPHNLAAFNALLRLHSGPIDASGWFEAGKLYLSLFGHDHAIPMKGESDEAGACGSSNECSVSFSDRPVVQGQAYNKWTLGFTAPAKGQPGMLTDVSKETVRP